MRTSQRITKQLCLALIVITVVPGAVAGNLKFAKVPDRIADRFVPAEYDAQRLEGILGERMRVNLEGRLLHVDEKGIIECFQHRPGPQAWSGEHAGKFLDAAVHAWQYSGDERLKTLMDRVARELIATQLPDGYLGTYSDDQRWTSWDVWVHKYDLIGLLSYYQATGYEPALETAKKIGDLLVRTFGEGPGQRDIIQAGEHMGMAATSVLEPMVDLYRMTGDAKYLEFCKYIVRAWDEPQGPKIIASLSTTGSVYKTANAKAYEMLSNLVGLAELYRVTGNPLYLKTAEIAWRDVKLHRLYVSGTSSSGEHFKNDGVLPGEDLSDVGEGCVTVTWLQFTWQLFRLTGEPQYAEQLEHTVYNALLGAQDPQRGDICYFTPLNGRKEPGPGISCCVSSEPRGIAMIPQLTWGVRENGAAVLLYAPGQVTLRTKAGEVHLESSTDYPLSGNVSLTVTPEKSARFSLYLRVPAWTTNYVASVGGEKYKGTAGQFLVIDRTWNRGDQVSIAMNLNVQVVPGGRSYPYSVAIARGPQFLALEERVNPEVDDLQAAGPRSMQVTLTDVRAALPHDWHGEQAYSFDGMVAGKPQKLTLVPFADARSYRVWMMKPAN